MAFDINNFEPVTIGPTWERDENGKFILPERSLGWECFRWTSKYLNSPNGGPWRYSPEQARFILWWYSVDEDGRFDYMESTLRRLKGWGKDPTIATLAAFELCGPCRFSHWGPDGQPVGVRHHEPWVQIAGPSREATKNSMKMFPGLFNKLARKDYALKIGKELIYADGGIGRIESLTSSAETAEGGRPSQVFVGEPHRMYVANGVAELVEVARANAGKNTQYGRILSVTNAFQPGLGSVAEQDWKAYEDILAGRAIDPGILYDSLEAPGDAPLTIEAIPRVLEVVRGDSAWLNVEEAMRRMLHPNMSEARARRFYYNQIVSTDDVLITTVEWDGCYEAGLTLALGDEVVLGLDGGWSDDSTALVALRLRDRAAFLLNVWEKPRKRIDTNDTEKWFVPMAEVDEAVATAFAKYKVRAFFSDVNPIQSYVDKWSDEYRDQLLIKATPKSSVGYDMRGTANLPEITRINEALWRAITDKRIKHQGRETRESRVLREHATNTYKAENRWGTSFRKESRESDWKVDAYAALVLAYIALNKYLESGKRPAPERRKRGWFM